MSGGHLPSDVGAAGEAVTQVYDLTKLEVDESRWFIFMQRRRVSYRWSYFFPFQ